jgi:16S rRNA (adenine1518-N6/adenine1519-N6)-dimethyltransferase
LFKKFLENPPAGQQPKSITFVVQKEVADRIMGSHFALASRGKKESILSISIKVYGKAEYGGIIKAGSFYPRPKVDSAIISIRDISKVKFEESGIEESKFFEILKAGFAHKRKLLIRNLVGVSRGTLDTLKLKEVFEKCDISDKTRAENLSPENWLCIAKKLT